MSRLIHSGLMCLVLILGLVSFGSGLASGQEEDEDEKRPEIKQPSLVELAKLYQELELPMPPKGAKVARIYVERFQVSSFGLSFSRQEGGKEAWYFWDGLKELQANRSFLETSKIFESSPKPEGVLHPLKMGRIHSPPNDFNANRSELIYCLHCHFLGYGELARFFYWRCKQTSLVSLDKTLIIAAWNYWVEELTNPKFDRAVIGLKLKKLVEKDRLFVALDYEDKNDSRYKEHLAILDQLDLTIKSPKPKAGALESLLGDLVDDPRRDPDEELSLTRSKEPREWDRKIQIQKSKKSRSHDGTEGIKKKIFQMGFEAIPGLIDHVDDLRLTRKPLRLNQGLYGARAWRSFTSNDFQTLNSEVRGILSVYFDFDLGTINGQYKAKREDYIEAWKKLKGIDELEYAISRLEKKRKDISYWFFSYLMARYPDKIVDFYERIVRKNPEFRYVDQFIYALIDGERPKEEKIRLLLLGLQSPNPSFKMWAMKGLIEVDQATFDRSYLDVMGKLDWLKGDEEAQRTFVEMANLGLSSEDPMVQGRVLEIAKVLLPEARVDWMKHLMSNDQILNKKSFLLFFQSFLNDKEQIEVNENKRSHFLNIFSYPGVNSVQVRNIAAYYYIKSTRCIDLSVNEKKGPREWAEIRNFVRNEIARQLEGEEGK